MTQKTVTSGIANAKQVIKKRRPSVDTGTTVFSLIKGIYLMIQPKTMFIDENGNKVRIRYVKDEASIFEAEQTGEDVKLETIVLEEKNVIRDPNLRDYLLINSAFNRKYKLIDPAGEAKKELDKLSKFDEVWDSVRQLSLENTKALNLLLTDTQLNAMTNTTMPELRLGIRKIALQDPERVKEAMEDPVLDTLYLYHMGVELGILKHIPRREVVIWTDSQKELCKVPVNKDPGMWTSRLLLTDDFIKSRELLESQLND